MSNPIKDAPLKPCPFCGGEATWMKRERPEEHFICCDNDDCFGPQTTAAGKDAITQWNTRASTLSSPDREKVAALRLLAAEDERQTKLHDLLEEIREQIRLGVAPEHRPDGLFQNIQNAVYAMRGRTPLMNDAAITSPLSTLALDEAAIRADEREKCRKTVRNAVLRLSAEQRAVGDILDHAIASAIRAGDGE